MGSDSRYSFGPNFGAGKRVSEVIGQKAKESLGEEKLKGELEEESWVDSVGTFEARSHKDSIASRKIYKPTKPFDVSKFQEEYSKELTKKSLEMKQDPNRSLTTNHSTITRQGLLSSQEAKDSDIS